MYQDQNPYAVNNDMFAADAALSERLAFLRKVYLHVFGCDDDFWFHRTIVSPHSFSIDAF